MTRISFGRTLSRVRLALADRVARYRLARAADRGEVLNVMTSCGGKNSGITQILIRSLSDAHPGQRINFWFFHLDVADPIMNRMARFCDKLPNVRLHPVRVERTDALVALKTLGGKPDCERFLWFVAHQYLPAELDRVIYIDALDTMVLDDLRPFLNQDLGDGYVLACHEFLARAQPPITIGPAREALEAGTDPEVIRRVSLGLINSGAMVLNLRRFRDEGIDLDHYVQTATWAQQQGLSFGDQGLFSLTFGSAFAPAHDRYNFRFGFPGAGRIKAEPAIVHFAGHVPKPFAFRPDPAQEQLIRDRAAAQPDGILPLGRTHRMRAGFLPHYRRWWAFSERTLVHQRIAPLADSATRKLLDRLGLAAEDAHGE